MSDVVAVIPSHLASARFPGKVLFPFAGLPMIEHVRRRALLAPGLTRVVVATCDGEIADVVTAGGGEVIMTGSTHTNGTSRTAEAALQLDCSHVLLLQGDEPLLLPRHVEEMIRAIEDGPAHAAWNATAPINEAAELDRHSFVKCAVGNDNRVLYAFRRTPSTAPFEEQRRYIRKVLGIIAYRRDYLLELASRPVSVVERYESIEQMRIVEGGDSLLSVPVQESLPSVNEPHEAEIVQRYLTSDPEQSGLLAQILD